MTCKCIYKHSTYRQQDLSNFHACKCFDFSHDFHKVLEAGLDRGFAKVQDCIAEFYKPLQKAESSVIQ